MASPALAKTRFFQILKLASAVVAQVTSLYDAFTTDASTPLTSPRTAEPGPGSWTVTDASNVISIASGLLTFSGTPAAVSGLISVASLARQAGRALFITIPTATFGSVPRLGLHTAGTITSGPQYGVDFGGAGTTYRVKTGVSATVNSISPGGAAPYELCFIMRSLGAYLLVRAGGAGGSWTLAYVWRTTSASLYVNLASNNAAVAFTLDNVYVVDLGDTSGYNLASDDYALASSRSAVSTDGETKTMAAADSLVQHVITSQTGVTQELMVRRTDDNNTWIIRMDQGGSTCAIIEKNAGAETSRASVAKTWTNGTQYRVVVRCQGNTIRVVADDGSELVSYTSATFQNTATGAKVSHAGTDFICWLASLTLTPPSP